MPFLSFHLEVKRHFIALQEVSTSMADHQPELSRVHPGQKNWGESRGGRNGVNIVAIKKVAPFVSCLKEGEIMVQPPLQGCPFGITVVLLLEE